MTRDQNQPSEWAMEEARKVYAKQTRAVWESISSNRNIDNGHIDRAKTEIIALALDAAVAERDEALRVSRTMLDEVNTAHARLSAKLDAAEKVVDEVGRAVDQYGDGVDIDALGRLYDAYRAAVDAAKGDSR